MWGSPCPVWPILWPKTPFTFFCLADYSFFSDVDTPQSSNWYLPVHWRRVGSWLSRYGRKLYWVLKMFRVTREQGRRPGHVICHEPIRSLTWVTWRPAQRGVPLITECEQKRLPIFQKPCGYIWHSHRINKFTCGRCDDKLIPSSLRATI